MKQEYIIFLSGIVGVILGWVLNISWSTAERARKAQGHKRVISKIFNQYIKDLYKPDHLLYASPWDDIAHRRWVVFVKLEDEIDAELSRRNSEISIKDERAIRAAFQLMREAASEFTGEPGPDMDLYEDFFLKQIKENKGLRWLDIPDKEDTQRSQCL